MEKRPLGKSDIQISALGIGCWIFGGTDRDYWGAHQEKDAAEMIAAALDQGINYLDVHEGYNNGQSEEVLGTALKGRRGEAVIGTKVSPQNTEPKVLREHCEASLRRLKTDYIDVYMIHWPIREHPVPEAVETLVALKREGKIRSIGVSNHGVQDMREVLTVTPEIDSNQLCYNLLSRGIEVDIVPMCMKNKIGIVTYMPLLQGILTGKFRALDEIPTIRMRTRHFRGDRPGARHGEPGAEDEVVRTLAEIRKIADELGISMAQLALAWTAAKPGIACVLAGARDVAQLKANSDGANYPIAPEVVARLDAATDPLLRKLGASADYWQGVADSRIR